MTVSSGHGSWITAADELSPSLIEMLSLCAKFLCVYLSLLFFFQSKKNFLRMGEKWEERNCVTSSRHDLHYDVRIDTIGFGRELKDVRRTRKVGGSAHCF
ncbi:hypothetical protein GHT06_008308 [Daphnia sinensis]|uniref:Uncharacterized protein n=1 Tax=Daphnia sinensis TaxID=1820382 RepID=A0AAD5Q208_9CRUS|nr:hypothetical protein GHT06_008308 [Daphnia sinensis]